MDDAGENCTLEDQFVLRLPVEQARSIKELLQQKPDKVNKLLRINMDHESKEMSFHIGKSKLFGTLKKLPTIVESYKTNVGNNKSSLFKTADICYLADCTHYSKSEDKLETIHGICPPLKNVKTKRFRKARHNNDNPEEADVKKELFFLLKADLEATSSRFEIIQEQKNDQLDLELFGSISNSSED